MSAQPSTDQDDAGQPPAGGTPAPLVPLKLSYVRVHPSFLKALRDRIGLRLLSWYAALFRQVWPLSRLWPLPRFVGMRLVVRHEHVREVFSRHDVLRVPFGEEIARLNDGSKPGTPFLLGVDDQRAHDEELHRLVKIFRLDDAARIGQLAYASAQRRLQELEVPLQAGKAFDAIAALLTAVPLDVCSDYYGVPIHETERKTFAHATMELSSHLFGKPPIAPSKDGQEDVAGQDVRAVVDRAIEREIAHRSGRGSDSAHRTGTGTGTGTGSDSGNDTVLARMVHEWGSDAQTRLRIRAALVGMIVGFVPTNTIASGHILEMLLRRRRFARRPAEMMEDSRHAAEMGDDDRLARCLFEALRFMPINVGRFRLCAEDHRIGGVLIRRGEQVLAMTGQAMLDRRQVKHPRRFDPTRPASDFMHFGFGMHWCVGAMIARAQITQTFKALLALRIARAGPLTYWGGFPEHLPVKLEKPDEH